MLRLREHINYRYNHRDSSNMNNENIIPLQIIDPSEKNSDGKPSYNELVNSFLAMANEHWQTVEIEDISAAIREAAARFNAFEAEFKSGNLEADRDNAVTWFTEEYSRSLAEFIDNLIENPNS